MYKGSPRFRGRWHPAAGVGVRWIGKNLPLPLWFSGEIWPLYVMPFGRTYRVPKFLASFGT